MTNAALAQTLENIYTSLHNDNDNLDTHIAALKAVLTKEGLPSVEVDTSRLPQGNRQGRKLMESHFKKRGVLVTFSAKV